MVVQSVLQLGGGLSFFILGMQAIKTSFYKLAGDKLTTIFSLLTVNLPAAVMTGLVVTALIQSSSATTVLIISLVNSGVLSVKQACGVVMGANIGTTITVQLFSFSLENQIGLIIASGLVLYLIYYFIGYNWLQYIARAAVGLGILFFGLDLLAGLVNIWQEADFFLQLIAKLSTIPQLGIIIGALITAVIQSSSALTGIVVVLAKTETIDLLGATALALGSNAGTCITAFLAGLGTSPQVKKVAWFHLFFNLVGVIILFPLLTRFVGLVSLTADKLARQIANAHTIFNIINTVLFILIIFLSKYFLQGGEKWSY